MFTFRRSTTLAVAATAAFGLGLSASSASAQPASTAPVLKTSPSVQPIALLLPAVQSAREAARRAS